jgi:hypothetical protein
MTYGIRSKGYVSKHLGPNASYSENLPDHSDVEDYIRLKCHDYGLKSSFDVTAQENPYFNTVNYTTYAGMIILHPLEFGQSLFQMYDAKSENKADAGHIDFLRDKIMSDRIEKYDKKFTVDNSFDAVAVLCGHNKFKQHIDGRKLDKLSRKYGKKLAIKPHPISDSGLLKYLEIYANFSTLLTVHDSLYSVIKASKKVYTTHISETALTGLIAGKPVEPIDHFQQRFCGSFGHINHFCFTEDDPLKVISSIFASSKSGIICPEVDVNWKAKVDEYFAYTIKRRMKMKGYYYG